jgi:serralysin
LQGGADNDILNGGTGADTVSYASAASPVVASLATDFATGEGSDLFSYVEGLIGSAAADTLAVADSDGSSNAANVLKGLGGNDTLDAADGVGNDTVDGGKGNGDVCQDKVANCP